MKQSPALHNSNDTAIVFSILLLLILSSCSNNTFAQRNRKSDRDKEPAITSPEVIPSDSVPSDVIVAPVPTETSDKKEKRTFNITLLLPLFLNEAEEIKEDTADVQPVAVQYVSNKAVQALDLYQGIKSAFDSLTSLGASFNINVFDTRMDDTTIRAICAKPEFYNADLVIGPVYNSSMKIAAEYAKKYNVPIVAPLSPAENITTDNEYFFQANPGIGAHCQTLFNYIAQHHASDNIILLHQAADKDAYADFRAYFDAASKPILYHDLIYTYGKYTDAANKTPATDLKSRLKSNANNIIVVASIDLQFAHKLSRELYNLSDDYTFMVFGLPIWNPENDLRLDYLEKINTHFTLGAHLPDTLYYAAGFAKKFNETYHRYPNDACYKGFDIGFFFGHMLMEHGKNFQKKIEDETFPANHTVFDFQKIYSPGSFNQETKFLHYENRHVFLFRYDNYTLKRLK